MLVGGFTALIARALAPEHEPRREAKDDPNVPDPSPTGTTKWPKPIYVGRRGDAQLEELLDDLDAFLRANAIDTSIVSASELTVMPKTDGPAYAIPDRSMWPNILGASRLVMEVRHELGFPLRLSGFRPADYNKAVGGAPKSQHVGFRAIDYRPVNEHNNTANRRKLALVSGRIFLANPTRAIGLGLYGYPTPSNGHFDTGYIRRTWEETKLYLADLKKVA